MEPGKKSNGALIGSIIIIVILIIGGIYVWQSKIKEVRLQKQLQIEAVNASTSEELNRLEVDLNMTNTNLDVDFETIQ